MEKNPTMKSKYLINFEIDKKISESMDCEWYKQKGVKGVVNRIFSKIKKDDKKEKEKPKDDKKNKSKINRFFKKAFGKED
jgi:Zn-finger protein